VEWQELDWSTKDLLSARLNVTVSTYISGGFGRVMQPVMATAAIPHVHKNIATFFIMPRILHPNSPESQAGRMPERLPDEIAGKDRQLKAAMATTCAVALRNVTTHWPSSCRNYGSRSPASLLSPIISSVPLPAFSM
jgi:hypothetical protein